jgi:hypothetical protein
MEKSVARLTAEVVGIKLRRDLFVGRMPVLIVNCLRKLWHAELRRGF